MACMQSVNILKYLLSVFDFGERFSRRMSVFERFELAYMKLSSILAVKLR